MCPPWVQSIHSACAGGTLQAQPSRETPGSCRLWGVLVCLLALSCHVHLSRQLLYDSLYTTWKDMKRFISYKEESGQERAWGGELSPSQVPFWFLRRFIFSCLPTPSLLPSFVKISLGLHVFYVFVLRDQEPVCKHTFQRAAISLALSRESFSRKSKRWRRQCFKCYCDFFLQSFLHSS